VIQSSPRVGRGFPTPALMERGIVADGKKRDVLTAARLGEVFGIDVNLIERDGYYHLW